MKTPGDYVRESRKKMKLSQAIVAAKLGITVQAISAFEQGLVHIPAKRAKELVILLSMKKATMMELMVEEYRETLKHSL